MNQSYIFFKDIIFDESCLFFKTKNPEHIARGHQNKTNSFSIAQFSHFLGTT